MRMLINRIIHPVTPSDWMILWSTCIIALFISVYLYSFDEHAIWCDQDILNKALIPRFRTPDKFSGAFNTSSSDTIHYTALQESPY